MNPKNYLLLPVYVLISFQTVAVVDCSKNNIFGVNILGLKAGIDSNIFSKTGPLAKAVDNLKTLKDKSDQFWNNVGENTANLVNKIGSTLTGSSDGASSETGSLSYGGENQGSVSETEQKNSENENKTKIKFSLTGKSTDTSNGYGNEELSEFENGKFSEGSSATGKGSATLTITSHNNNFEGGSQNSNNEDFTNLNLPNDSDSVNNEGSGTISLPTIVIDGGTSGSHKSSGGSYTWSWVDRSGSSSPTSSSDGSTGWSHQGRSISRASVSSGDDLSSDGSSSGSSKWHLRKVFGSHSRESSSGVSSVDESPSWHVKVTSGSTNGELSPSSRTSAWSLGGSGRSTREGGSSNQQSSIDSGSSGTTRWTFSGHDSGRSSEEDSNDVIRGSESTFENSGKDTSASPSGKLVGVNVLGLKAGFCTNLFDKDGPLAKAGENLKNILEGKKLTNLSDLNNILGVNIGDMKADLTTNLFGNGKASNAHGQQEILGKSIFGFHEGLNTNIFSGNGPIAKVGNDIKNLLQGKLSLGDIISGKGSSASSNKDLVGVNALGVKLALCTNLFDKDGPLAKAGADVNSFFKNLGDANGKLWSSLKNALGGGSA